MSTEQECIVHQLKECGISYSISETDVRRVTAWADECQAAGLARGTAIDLACRLYANRMGRTMMHCKRPVQDASRASIGGPSQDEIALAAEIVKFASKNR